MESNSKSFSKTFDMMKTIAITSIVMLFITNGIWIYLYNQLNDLVNSKVFVVTDSGSFWATEKNRDDFNQYEAKNFVKVFAELIFAHDAQSYKGNMERALPLVHKDYGGVIKVDYEKNKLWETYVNYDASTSIKIDSIIIDNTTRPAKGAIYMIHSFNYGANKKESPLAYGFTLDRVERSEKNPYGLFLSSLNRIGYAPAVEKRKADEPDQNLEREIVDSIVNTSPQP